jgi:hypothetical protein
MNWLGLFGWLGEIVGQATNNNEGQATNNNECIARGQIVLKTANLFEKSNF